MARGRGDPGRAPSAPRRLARQHARDLVDSLGRLYRAPLSSLLTAAVIGITLVLPAALHVVFKNLDALSYRWEGTVQASLFLAEDLDERDGRRLAERIAAREGVAGTEFVSRAEALAEFRELSGLGPALDALEDNPLPAVIVVRPETDRPAADIDALVDTLAAEPGVARAQLDQAWLRRLYAILDVAERGVTLLAALLALAVLFIVGNTIRLDIENRRAEIEVMKLVGAPDDFIRRPFLYSGFWYGLAGGLLAWLLLGICLLALAGPVRELAGLYGSDAGLQGLGLRGSLWLIAAGVALGWLGSAATVARRLRAIEPE
ncbi:cell division protein [Salinisphaera sp. PC39]|uniref:permease-like cell division protein FtsX n=1 Tax=Salinisphaera sp. PC39 TaxID=1304156 RepID=UPI003341769D